MMDAPHAPPKQEAPPGFDPSGAKFSSAITKTLSHKDHSDDTYLHSPTVKCNFCTSLRSASSDAEMAWVERVGRPTHFDGRPIVEGDFMSCLVDIWLGIPMPTGEQGRTFERLGVSFQARQLVGGLAISPITKSKDKFTFDHDGALSIILPVWADPPSIQHAVEDPDLIDLLAFRSSAPTQFWLFRGLANMLGEAALLAARWYGSPLPVYGNPLSWLRSGGAGVMPLDWPGFAREMLWYPEIELVVSDVRLGERLKREIDSVARVRKPRISIDMWEAA